ncbi:unnamed protein product [Darwinula stevensoni]|uniref:SPRY domain-containing SOCS box protein 3 n=1 Tax=Darwinula stevensoni TaxID=69355 RepID=A0A7R8X6V0_9CRUS|nr:unnamed protein product [Darwinula stevensoni]CAG0879832.1 unnamed protein product [Darwinula stevensoni]
MWKIRKGKMNPQEENPREFLGAHHHMAMLYHPLSLEMPMWPAYRYPVREIAREAASRFRTTFDERRQILRNQHVESPFCDCLEKKAYASCHCGEEDTEFDWHWDNDSVLGSVVLTDTLRDIKFHPVYSSGTAAIKGCYQFQDVFHHYWEVKMTTPVYGTSMMVGVGSKDLDVSQRLVRYCSLLGQDEHSWGLSHLGEIHHKGKVKKYCQPFGQGCIVGLYLDLWKGTLSYFLNRKPLGVAFHGLKHQKLYPMVSSTAARSGMRLVSARSFPMTLQLLCLEQLRHCLPKELSILDAFPWPPGFARFLCNNFWWIVTDREPLRNSTIPVPLVFLGDEEESRKRRGDKTSDLGDACSSSDEERQKRLKTAA